MRADQPSPVLQRAEGLLRLTIRRRGAASVLDDLRQDGCLKARFPRRLSDPLEAVLLNSSGGVAAGDRLTVEVALAPGASTQLSSQAAERFYRARPGDRPAQLRTAITVAEGASAEWLPQQSILFDGAALERSLEVSVARGGRFLGLEALVFGRAAMGEHVRSLHLADRVRIVCDGRLRLQDAVRFGPDAGSMLARGAGLGGAGAAATLWLVADDAEQRLAGLRRAWQSVHGIAECGASAWDGLLIGRIISPTAAALRAALLAGLAALRDAAPPRVWLS